MAEPAPIIEVQLGFAEPFEDEGQNNVFASKVGGRPVCRSKSSCPIIFLSLRKPLKYYFQDKMVILY